MQTQTYIIKCDECKTEIGATDSLRTSASGGLCEQCSVRLTLQAIASMRVDDTTDHAQLSALCIATARIELDKQRS